MAVMTGLSGNEIYGLHLKGMLPGELVVGNSVYAMGLFGSLGAGVRNMMGGEVTQVTQIIHEGRAEYCAHAGGGDAAWRGRNHGGFLRASPLSWQHRISVRRFHGASGVEYLGRRSWNFFICRMTHRNYIA